MSAYRPILPIPSLSGWFLQLLQCQCLSRFRVVLLRSIGQRGEHKGGINNDLVEQWESIMSCLDWFHLFSLHQTKKNKTWQHIPNLWQPQLENVWSVQIAWRSVAHTDAIFSLEYRAKKEQIDQSIIIQSTSYLIYPFLPCDPLHGNLIVPAVRTSPSIAIHTSCYTSIHLHIFKRQGPKDPEKSERRASQVDMQTGDQSADAALFVEELAESTLLILLKVWRLSQKSCIDCVVSFYNIQGPIFIPRTYYEFYSNTNSLQNYGITKTS